MKKTIKSSKVTKAVSVKPKQVFMDLDPRKSGRKITVLKVQEGIAHVTDGNRRTAIRVDRLTSQGSRGFAKVKA